jgi:TPP-dependent pyruvate/acetoin dehydrogenase alpha subunit
VRYQTWLEANHMIHPDDLARIETEVAAEIAEAVAFAEVGSWEPVEQLTRFTYADRAREPVGEASWHE